MRTKLITTASILMLMTAPVLAQTAPSPTPRTPPPAAATTPPPAAAIKTPSPDPLKMEDVSKITGSAVYGSDDSKIGSVSAMREVRLPAMPFMAAPIMPHRERKAWLAQPVASSAVSSAGWAKNFPSPLAGEGGDPRSGEGEGYAAAGVHRRDTPHLPIAPQWVPSSPALAGTGGSRCRVRRSGASPRASGEEYEAWFAPKSSLGGGALLPAFHQGVRRQRFVD